VVARLYHSPGPIKALLVELMKYRAPQEEEIQLALRCGRGLGTVNGRIQADLANIFGTNPQGDHLEARNRAADVLDALPFLIKSTAYVKCHV
jgi:hypothetical protein